MVKSGGLVLQKRSRKDFDFDKIFGGVSLENPKPIGRIDEIKNSNLPLVFQENFPACVTATFSWINSYFSWKENASSKQFSWPFLFKLANPSQLGTKPRIVADLLRREGVCEWSYYDVEKYANNESPSEESFQNAGNYRVKNFSFLTDLSPAGLYRACQMSPIAIGFGVNQYDWVKGEVVKQINQTQFYHMTALVDFTLEGDYVIVNWWNPNEIDVWTMNKDYPIAMAVSFQDLPDDVSKKEVRTGFWNAIKYNYFL